jgi:hypothetical protein
MRGEFTVQGRELCESDSFLVAQNSVTLETIFKKKFGGKEIAHSDFFDVVVNPFWYHLYNFRKRIKKISL